MHFLIAPLRHVPESPLQRLPIAFLGGGNMADALIGGLVAAGHDADAVTVIEPDAERASALGARHGVRVQAPGSALPSDGIVVLAVKPQQAAAALAETPPPPGSLLVSIAAGLSCDWLGSRLPAGTPVAQGFPVPRETLELVRAGKAPKGSVIATAELAGVMAAKRTAELIPLCHPLALSKIEVTVTPDDELPGFVVDAMVRTEGRTGVEMEALTAVSAACLTLLDMLKAVDKTMSIDALRVTAKEGGRSGAWRGE